MADTSDKALDALVERYRQVAGTMRKMKAASIEAYEIDAGADTITALRRERDDLREEVKAERLANGHEKRLRLDVIAQHQKTEAERDALRAQLATARADALRDAGEACTNVIKNYDVMKPDGITYEPMRVQKAAKNMVSIARQDILALIDQPATSATTPKAPFITSAHREGYLVRSLTKGPAKLSFDTPSAPTLIDTLPDDDLRHDPDAGIEAGEANVLPPCYPGEYFLKMEILNIEHAAKVLEQESLVPQIAANLRSSMRRLQDLHRELSAPSAPTPSVPSPTTEGEI